MKIKKVITVLMISFSLLFTNALSNVFAYENENYNINYVDNIEEFKVDLKEEKSKNKINFYVDNKFQNSTARKNKINTFENMKDQTEDEIANVSLYLAVKYKMDIYGKQVNGEIYATDTVELSGIIDKIETITEEYNDNIVHEAYKAKTLYNMNNLSVGQDWALLGETKVDAILNHKNTYYASFSEWRSTFQLKTYNSTHSYFAFLNETYITPSTSKTDFRTDELIYKFDPTLGANTELRDYQPKSKPPSATIGYSTSISGEITDSGDAKIGTSISNSYSTLEESPKLHDQGNMRLNYAEIRFDYLRPFDNKGIYYDYNVGQSYQSSVFVIKAKKQSQDIIIQNDRDVTIVRDGFWSNSIITFELKSKITILR